MNAQTILILFFALCFIIMTIKYVIERKRYENANFNRKYWLKKYKQTLSKLNSIQNN